MATNKTRKGPKSVDDYLAGLSSDKRAALERVRKIILGIAPGVEESISYQIPAYRLDGKVLVYFGASANHCALYALGSSTDDLEGYDTSGKGTIRFQQDEPLPAALIRKLLKARIAKNSAAKKKPARKSARKR